MYCTIQDIKDVVPEGLLAYLSGGNDAIIARAIENAQATINAYIAGAYDPSNALGAGFLQGVAERIAVYNLYVAAAADDTPQIVVTSYLEAISDLEKIQKGFLSLSDAQEAQNERQGEVFTNKDALDRLFPADRFLGF